MGPGLSTANAKSKNRFLLVLQLKLILGPICALYFYCPISCLVKSFQIFRMRVYN